MNDLEVMIGMKKVFVGMDRLGMVSLRIGYGDSGAPEFTLEEWEDFKRQADALLTLFCTEAVAGEPTKKGSMG